MADEGPGPGAFHGTPRARRTHLPSDEREHPFVKGTAVRAPGRDDKPRQHHREPYEGAREGGQQRPRRGVREELERVARRRERTESHSAVQSFGKPDDEGTALALAHLISPLP